MLKILINNEEVVCDKQLEIKEEMLSTSSCILNNCYPKTWEQDHDYVSRFYYPKDYSKCVIKDEVNIPAEEGEYATGTSLNINVDNTKEWSYQLEGDTQQNTSILPSGYTQVDYIQSSGAQYIDTNYYCNPNTKIEVEFQFDYTNINYPAFGCGSEDEDGLAVSFALYSRLNVYRVFCGDDIPNAQTISLTSDTSKHLFVMDLKNGIIKVDSNSYNMLPKETNPRTNNSNNSLLIYANRSSNGNVSNTKARGRLYSAKIYNNNILVRNLIPCYRNSDSAVGLYDIVNDVFYINQGDGAFTYGSVANIPNPDYPQNVEVVTGEQNIQIIGKNLIEPKLPTTTKNGITITNNGDGSWTLNGTATSNVDFRIDQSTPAGHDNLKTYNGTYTLSCNELINGMQLVIMQINTWNILGRMINSNIPVTFTNNKNNCFIYVFVSNGTTLNNLTIYPQLEKGSQATSFEPYQSQNYPVNLSTIELCKIGNYQDYIYNQNGDWYLHKETNKILLDGDNNKLSYGGIEYGHPLFHKNINDIINVKDYSYLVVMSTSYGTFQQTEGDITSPKYMGNFKIRASVANNRMFVRDDRFTSTNEINDWLQSNNVLAYYVMQNAINTQITDTTLIQQLDNLKNATLFNGINNITVSGNLPSILNLHYNFVIPRTDITLLFCGVVKNTGNINLNPRYPHYCSLEVLDFKTFLSECEQLDFVINNKTVSEAIEQVTQAVASYGFVVGNININDDTIIGAYSTQEKTPYDVFQYLADISQSRWYTRLVDENTVAIDFYDPTAMQRGIDLDFSNNTFACENNIEDLSFNYGTYDYRNKQIMLSNQVFGGVDFEETIVADGYNKIFNTTTPIGILKGITVNGSSSTFATNEDKEMGVEADFYYNPGQTQIESNENDGTYPANTIIVVGYTPLVKGRQVISDTTEISRIATQTGRNGTISRYEKRNDVLSSDELELIGNSYLKYKGTPEINLTVVTKDVDLYNIGQIVYFNYPNIEDLSKDYMVKSKRTKIINTATDWNIWYTYTLTSNFNSENAINYFDNQRAKSSGNIKVGDYITRNVDIEDSCMIIFSNPTATEITISDNNILNAPLNAPFTQ